MRCARFRADHAELADLAEELRWLLTPPEREAKVRAAQNCLDELMGRLALHLEDEAGELYPVLSGCPDADVAELADKFVADMAATSAHLERYWQRWSTEAIAADVDRFTSETMAVLDQLADRLQENRALYTAAEKLTVAA